MLDITMNFDILVRLTLQRSTIIYNNYLSWQETYY